MLSKFSHSLDGFVIEVRGSGFVYSALYEVDVSLVVSSQGHVQSVLPLGEIGFTL
jgi:hypothetical protein